MKNVQKTFTWILNSQSWYHFDKQTCILIYTYIYLYMYFSSTPQRLKNANFFTAFEQFFFLQLYLQRAIIVKVFEISYLSATWPFHLDLCFTTMQFYSRHVNCWMFLASFCTFSRETNLSIFDALKRQCGADFFFIKIPSANFILHFMCSKIRLHGKFNSYSKKTFSILNIFPQSDFVASSFIFVVFLFKIGVVVLISFV